MKVTFEIDTNMTPERIKALLIEAAPEIPLAETPKDYAEIETDSITVEP